MWWCLRGIGQQAGSLVQTGCTRSGARPLSIGPYSGGPAGIYGGDIVGDCTLFFRRRQSTGNWEWSLDNSTWSGEEEGEVLGATRAPDVGDQVFKQRLLIEAPVSATVAGIAAPDRTAKECGRDGRAPTPPPAARAQPASPTIPPINPAHPVVIRSHPSDPVGYDVPREFICPVSMELMTAPMITPAGVSYNRAALERWVLLHGTDPASGRPITVSELYPNLALRDMIQRWLVEHRLT